MLKKQSRIDKKLFTELFKKKPDLKFFGVYSMLSAHLSKSGKFGVVFKKNEINNANRRNYIRRISYKLYSAYLLSPNKYLILSFNKNNIKELNYSNLEKDFIYYKKCLQKS